MNKKRVILVLCVLLLLAIPLSITIWVLHPQQVQQGSTNKHVRNLGSTVVPLYEKFELTFPYSRNYSNPNDPSQVDVEAVFTTPNGQQQKVPGFFFQDFKRSGSTHLETLTYVPGSDSWKIRYAPSQIGNYTYTVTLTDSNGTVPLGNGTFSATTSSNPGFIRASGYHLVRDNGQMFIPLGVNAPWFQKIPQNSRQNSITTWGDGTYGVDTMYQHFMQYGVNFFHLWTCNWGFGTPQPWAKPNIGCDGSPLSLSAMSQPDSWDVDYMMNQARLDNMYVMPILKHRDQHNFTTADQIKARYFVARWGYSTNIVAWDFNKEGAFSITANHAWASYLNSIDPYQHLRTTSEGDHYPLTSASNLKVYNQIFGDPLMTLVQTHDYTNDCSTGDFGNDSALALFYMKLDPSGTDPRDFHHFNKPSIFGETGIHPSAPTKGNLCGGEQYGVISPFYSNDNNGLIVKSEIWGSLMSSSGVYGAWYIYRAADGSWTQFAGFKAASAYVAALPPVPDSANLFTSYHDTSQATVSDARIRVIGRKNSTFAMLFVQNTTGTWGAILRNHTPTRLAATINLLGMQSGATFTVKWYDTDTGALVATNSSVANLSHLTLTSPTQITENIAAIVTLASP